MTEEIKIPSGIVDNGTEVYFDIHKLDMSMLQVYKDEIDRLKQENEKLETEDIILTCENDCLKLRESICRKALEEIREMCNKHLDAKGICYATQVIDLINEVLV